MSSVPPGGAGTVAAMASGFPPGTVRAVLRHPDVWPVAVRQALRLAPGGWWRRAPFLPVPDPDYLRFRMVTAYGGDGRADDAGDAAAEDLVTYLRWCRAWPQVTSPTGD